MAIKVLLLTVMLVAAAPLSLPQHLCGVYRSIVENNVDPAHRARVEVRVPDANNAQLWALPGSSAPVPTVGTQVWVMFEAGDANRPVWFGAVPPGI